MAIIRFKGQRYKLATGVSVVVQYWDTKAMRAKKASQYPDAEVANILLDIIDTRLAEVFTKHRIEGTLPVLTELKSAIKGSKPHPASRKKKMKTDSFIPFFETFYLNADYKEQTKKKYKTTLGWLQKYEHAFKRKLTFNNIDIDFYDQFRSWILSQKYCPREGEEERYYTANYFGSLIKCVKRVMKATGPMSRLKMHDNMDYAMSEFKIDAEPADTIYLSVDELLKIHHYTPTLEDMEKVSADKREENLRRKMESMLIVKNKFLIGAFTALRVSDFNRLREVNIKENTIRIKPRKGTRKNEDVVIPIHPVIREIIDSGFDISTKISDQNINERIKEVCQLVEINELISVSRTEGGSLAEHVFPKYKLVSTHTARRSGATNMYLAGIPAISIMKITGHRTEKSFMKYIKISQEENARLLAEHAFFSTKRTK